MAPDRLSYLRWNCSVAVRGVAMSLRKGSRRHGLAGDVFVISMLGLAGERSDCGVHQIPFNEFSSSAG